MKGFFLAVLCFLFFSVSAAPEPSPAPAEASGKTAFVADANSLSAVLFFLVDGLGKDPAVQGNNGRVQVMPHRVVLLLFTFLLALLSFYYRCAVLLKRLRGFPDWLHPFKMAGLFPQHHFW